MNWNISTEEGMRNAVEWQKRHVSLIATGGVWFVPRSASSITINHETKTATRTIGLMPEPDIAKVFRAMGWTWKDNVND